MPPAGARVEDENRRSRRIRLVRRRKLEGRDLEGRPAGTLPALLKDDGHVPRGRPLEPGMRIAPRPGPAAREGRAVFVPDVHAARESHAPVEDEDLAVVAIRLIPEERKERVIKANFDVPLLHLPPEPRPRVARAERVGEDAHPDAAPHGGRQSFDEEASGGVVLEDVRLEEDFVLGAGDRGAHRGERGRAVEEDRDGVAAVDRRRVDPPEKHFEFRVPHALRQGLGEERHARGPERAGEHPKGHRAQDGPEEPRRRPPVLLSDAA